MEPRISPRLSKLRFLLPTISPAFQARAIQEGAEEHMYKHATSPSPKQNKKSPQNPKKQNQMGNLPLSSKFIHKLMFESGHIVLMYSSRCFPLFLLVVVLLSSLHHKHFLGLAVHLQFCYNEEGHVSVISIIRSIHLLMYDTLIFPFL